MAAALGTFAGILYSVMNLLNARLGDLYGNAVATVLIHAVGLACALPLAVKALFRGKIAPLWMYLGGLLGIFTVVTSNLGVSALGITLTLCLTLLGQLLCSMAFDQLGLWGFAKAPIKPRKAASLLVILAGIGVMLLW